MKASCPGPTKIPGCTNPVGPVLLPVVLPPLDEEDEDDEEVVEEDGQGRRRT